VNARDDAASEETAEEAAFRARVREALSARLRARPTDSRFTVMGGGTDDVESGRHFLAVLAEGGYATPRWPVEHGGMGATPEQAEIVAQELSGFDVPDLYPFMVGIGLVGPTLMTHGTPEQQARWLPKIRSGEEIWCQLFSEPDAGSDLAGLTSRAIFDEKTGVWEVSGSKVWSSRAHYSVWGLLLARSDFSVPKHAGLTAFAVRMDAPGVEVRPLRQMNGDAHFNEVFLSNAPIPDEDRVGGVGEGWRVAITTLMHERGSIGGRMGVSVDEVRELARERGVAHDAVARDRLARSISNLEVARFTGLRARAVRRHAVASGSGPSGGQPGPEGSGGKLRMSATLKELADAGLDLQGPGGMLAAGSAGGGGNEWKTLFLTGPSLSIRGGTDEIQRNIIGERVLGLPPEPRVDKDKPFSPRA
jgi:alkylation response protein AidB-like acyl-CoA dehydrogenase